MFVPATFTAHVYTDKNANNTQDGGETDLSGVTVNLLDGKGNPTGKTAVTDSKGNVSFTGLTPGDYEISVVTPTGTKISEQTNIQTPTTLTSGGAGSATEGLYTPVVFNAHVYTDKNANNTQDGGETDLSGVTVVLLDGKGNPTGKTAVTDGKGNVSFTGLTPGDYQISVVTPTGSKISEQTNIQTPTTLTSGQTGSANEGLYVPGTFTAHVYTDTNANKSQDGDETDLSGVTVNLLDGNGNPTGKTAVTDSKGNVSFTGLTPGSYEIAVVTPTGATVSEQTNVLTPNVLVSGGSATATEGVFVQIPPFNPAPPADPFNPSNPNSNTGKLFRVPDPPTTQPLGDYTPPLDPNAPQNQTPVGGTDSASGFGSNVFLRGDAQARQLYIEARNADGGPLPSWLTFDPATLSFSGSPPPTVKSPITIIVVIRDNKGNQTFVDVPVLLTTGGDTAELLGQINSDALKNAIKKAFSAFAARTASNDTPSGVTRIAGVFMPEVAVVESEAVTEGRSAFSTQLHQAGRMGRLAQARAFLDVFSAARSDIAA